MIVPVLIQPRAALLFASGGMLYYILFAFFKVFSAGGGFILKNISDALSGILAGAVFILITHLGHGGVIEYYTVLAYLAGFFLSYSLLRGPVYAAAEKTRLLAKKSASACLKALKFTISKSGAAFKKVGKSLSASAQKTSARIFRKKSAADKSSEIQTDEV